METPCHGTVADPAGIDIMIRAHSHISLGVFITILCTRKDKRLAPTGYNDEHSAFPNRQLAANSL
jgi:hypothetical protein